MENSEKAKILKDADWIQTPGMDPVLRPAFKDPTNDKMYTLDEALAIQKGRKAVKSVEPKVKASDGDKENKKSK